jgi:small-conductance mechanosensitive channel
MTFDIALSRVRDLAASTLALLPGLGLGLLVFGLFLLAARVVRAALQRAAGLRGMAPGVGIVLGRVAFGFAFRDILQNLLAGILILLTRPFRIGAQTVTGSYEGTVEDIQVRATTIRTHDNRRAVIPNSTLFGDKVLVNTADDGRRLQVRVGIGYGDGIGGAKQVILDAMRDAAGILADPAPQVRVAELGDFAVQLDVLFWIDLPIKREALDAVDAVLERIKPALQRAGVDLPFPTTQVLFHDRTEASAGDRTGQREGWPAQDENPRARWRVLQEGVSARYRA